MRYPTREIDRPIELRASGDDANYIELRVVTDDRYIRAQIGFAPGDERYVALLLHELVARGRLDVRIVRHWFELCAKGDGPRVGRGGA